MFQDAHITEPIAVPDIFVSELHCIEDIGDGMVRVVFTTNQINPHDHTPERVICLRIIGPKASVPRSLARVAQFFGWHLLGEVFALARENDAARH